MPTGADSVFLLSAKPFGGALESLLRGYYRVAPKLYAAACSDEGRSEDLNVEVNAAFAELRDDSNHFDPHIVSGGLRARASKPLTRDTRASLLLKRMFERGSAVERALATNKPKDEADQLPLAAIFSPLYFARQILTDPAFPASDAYAHVIIRAYIFEQGLRYHLRQPRAVKSGDDALSIVRGLISFEAVSRSLAKINRHRVIRDNVPMESATDFIVYHLLASRGYLMLRLPRELPGEGATRTVSLDSFFEGEAIDAGGRYDFRIAAEISRLPEPSEVQNELDGIPLPIPGADVVFHRGIRSTESSGLVARLSGRAGTGKTSIALSIAVALAPMGTRTIYLSCEEQEIDLLQRIRTLEPDFVKRTSSRRDPKRWFNSKFITGSADEKHTSVVAFLENLLAEMGADLPSKGNTAPGLVPLFIVLDGLHEMFSGCEVSLAASRIRGLIERCQQTGALVLLMSASARPELDELDYLVDLAATIEYAPQAGSADPPVRLLQLVKTRRQISRTGHHVVHLSGSDGLRISPQVGAQLDYRRGWRWVEPDDSRWYDFLLKPGNRRGGHVNPLVRIFDRSHVLVGGMGSSGKSAFALRAVASQLISVPDRSGKQRDQRPRRADIATGHNSTSESNELIYAWYKEVDPSRRRFLILSFLYQEQYYRRLFSEIKRNMRRDTLEPGLMPDVDFEVRTFSPGFLRAEDFLRIVNSKLEGAELQGEPFQAVVLDGIHNVYLQFPFLENHEMVWPALYEMLRTRGVTTVTTHTHFQVSTGGVEITDVEAARRRVGPLLHALVQASDLQISINPLKEGDHRRLLATKELSVSLDSGEEGRFFRVGIEGSIDWQRVRDDVAWLWDRRFSQMVALPTARSRAEVESAAKLI